MELKKTMESELFKNDYALDFEVGELALENIT